MHRQEDRKPSPVDRFTPVVNQASAEKAGESRKVKTSSSPATDPESNLSGIMLAQGVEVLNREGSGADAGPVGRSTSSPALAQLDEVWEKDLSKINLPEYVKANATTITFPEKLMLMLIHIEQVFAESGKKPGKAPIEWALDGRAFIIRDREELVQSWLPMFFRYGKFSSFTRKLYRWGFRQVNLPRDNQQEKRELIFANPHFQKEKRPLMVHMKSVTAASTRREKEEKQLNESKLPDNMAEPPIGSLMSLGTPRFVDSILLNQHGQSLSQPRPVALPTLSGSSLFGQPPTQPTLDPVVRQLLLGQQNRDFGGLLVDLHRQQQASQQLRIPSASSFSLTASEPFGLSQNFAIAPPPVPRHPFESLLEARSPVPAATAAAATAPASAGNIETINRERLIQERLRELAEQLLRGNANNEPPGPRPP